MHPTNGVEPFSWAQPEGAESWRQSLDFVELRGASVNQRPLWGRIELHSTTGKHPKETGVPYSFRDGSPFLPLGLGCKDTEASRGGACLIWGLKTGNVPTSGSSCSPTSRPLQAFPPVGPCTKFVPNDKLLKNIAQSYLQATYKFCVWNKHILILSPRYLIVLQRFWSKNKL